MTVSSFLCTETFSFRACLSERQHTHKWCPTPPDPTLKRETEGLRAPAAPEASPERTARVDLLSEQQPQGAHSARCDTENFCSTLLTSGKAGFVAR
eukprot:3684906-Amphidinium_carterae.1